MSVVAQCCLYYSTAYPLNKHISNAATCEQAETHGEISSLILFRHDPTDYKITQQDCYTYKSREYKTPKEMR